MFGKRQCTGKPMIPKPLHTRLCPSPPLIAYFFPIDSPQDASHHPPHHHHLYPLLDSLTLTQGLSEKKNITATYRQSRRRTEANVPPSCCIISHRVSPQNALHRHLVVGQFDAYFRGCQKNDGSLSSVKTPLKPQCPSPF